MNITVFTTGPGCHKCLVTKTHLKKREIPFEEIRIDQNPEWHDRVKALGFLTAPVVLVGDEDVWDGYSSDSIEEWANEFAQKVA